MESEWCMSMVHAGAIDLRGGVEEPRPRPLMCGHLDGILYTNWHLPIFNGRRMVRMNYCDADGRIQVGGTFWGLVITNGNFPYGIGLQPVLPP